MNDTNLESFTKLDNTYFATSGELAAVKGDLKKLLQNQFDDKADIDRYRAEIRQILWVLFAKETPGVFANAKADVNSSEKETIWVLTLQNFLRTTRIAYPFAYDFCRMHDAELLKKDLVSIINEPQPVINRIVEQLTQNDWLTESFITHHSVGETDINRTNTSFHSTVMLDDRGLIGEIFFQGRTKSPHSGTMGAHTTAWVAHTDAVRSSLVDLSLEDAVSELKLMIGKAMASELMKLSSVIDEKHQFMLVEAYTVTKALKSKEIGDIDPGKRIAHLEELIYHYLNLVNLTPTATISVGKLPDGRSEGQHRQYLISFEEQEATSLTASEKATLTNHIWGLFEDEALESFPPDLAGIRDGEVDIEAKHDLYQSIRSTLHQKDVELNKMIYSLQDFVDTIARAYPKSFAASTIMDTIINRHPTVRGQLSTPRVIQKRTREPVSTAISPNWNFKISLS